MAVARDRDPNALAHAHLLAGLAEDARDVGYTVARAYRIIRSRAAQTSAGEQARGELDALMQGADLQAALRSAWERPAPLTMEQLARVFVTITALSTIGAGDELVVARIAGKLSDAGLSPVEQEGLAAAVHAGAERGAISGAPRPVRGRDRSSRPAPSASLVRRR